MADFYIHVFLDDEKTNEVILEAREIFGNKKTTRDQYEIMMKTVGLAMVHCSEKMKGFAQSTWLEANMRKVYYEYMWGIRGE